MFDWGIGSYEETAVELAPVADRLVELAGVRSGDRVLDVGCGTGNAALAAARSGARATGVDPAGRLVAVAAAAAEEEGVDARFLEGEAGALPFEDGSFDVVLSNFAVIFAPDPPGAAGELLRVLAPGGRAAVSAWSAGNPLSNAMAVFGEALRPPRDGGEDAPSFSWSDEAAAAGLFESRGATVSIERGQVSFADSSAESFMQAMEERHPMGLAARAALEKQGRYDELRPVVLDRLEAANDDPGAFRLTSRYFVLLAER